MKKDHLLQKLKDENIEGFDVSIPPPKSAGNYIAVKKAGNLAYISGQMPVLSSGVILTIDENETIDFGYKAAKIAMANALNQLLYDEGIEEIISIVRIDGYFNKRDGNDLAQMLNGASDLIARVFGKENGLHARTVFGVTSVPYNAFLEIVVIAEVL